MLRRFADRRATTRKNKGLSGRLLRFEGLENRSLLSVLPPGPMQGGTPHYFGPEPNWAYSPQPTVDPVSGNVTGGIRKFVDSMAGLTAAGANNLGQYIPVAVPDTTTYPGSDYYEIELGQYTEKMHSDLDPTTLRGYRQTNTTDPTVSQFHYLGPTIVAMEDRPVRIKFTNSLPTGAGGDLFLPVDTTVMGAGTGPNMAMPMMAEPVGIDPTLVEITTADPHTFTAGMLVKLEGFTPAAYNGEFRVDSVPDATHFRIALKTDPSGPATVLGSVAEMYTDNRGTLHLHGGLVPWISDGTQHQWISPAGEFTNYDKGASVQNVPDMPNPGDGSMTFFWPNQQSSRLMFYHDHAFGITRLNVYAGEAAGYLLTDSVEQDLIARGIIPAAQIPLIIQDKTFIDPTTILTADPTWPLQLDDALSNLWMPHVYMPNNNPNALDGVNPIGRWDYGPWIWPPFPVEHLPIEVPDGSLGFGFDGRPDVLPNLPDVSMGMESFMDTPVVNGTVYPYLDVQPQAYRFRVLNAANDRFWNLQIVQADPLAPTEVRMVPFAPVQPNGDPWPADWPTPDLRAGGIPDPTKLGPDIIQIGTEGGFLPAPVVFPNIPIGWDRDPKSTTVGNILEHNLFLGNAERADVIVDFSQFAGQTLILYNDAPAAVPANDARYDYYTGNPDLTDMGGSVSTRPGYGPNTRTIMQIRVAPANPANPPQPFDLTTLQNEFITTPTHEGVFVRNQDPIIVPQAEYNSAYGLTGAGADTFPSGATAYERIESRSLTFNPLDLSTPALADRVATPVTISNEGKAIIEEWAPDWGRMESYLGIEMKYANNLNQTSLWFRVQDPVTEVINDTADPLMTPIGSLADGTQIWKITHNGVDTHPIHFHLFNVQVINRVDWVGVVKAPEPNELGWKETVRMNPLEDTIVALRPVTPKQPFGVPDSVRLLDPTMPQGSTAGFVPFDAQGQDANTVNDYHNFGWEYVWHCHILSHEEMNMMRPIQVNVARSLPAAPTLFAAPGTNQINLLWTDATRVSDPDTMGNPASEIAFRIERADVDAGGNPGTYLPIGSALANATAFTDAAVSPLSAYSYRVVAFNAAGESTSNTVLTVAAPPTVAAPNNLAATLQPGPQVSLTWLDNAADETGFVVERSDNGGAFTVIAMPAASAGAGNASYVDNTVQPGNTYVYRVCAVNGPSASDFSNAVTMSVFPIPLAPTGLAVTLQSGPSVSLVWLDHAANETGFVVERSDDHGAFIPLATLGPMTGTGNVSYVDNTVLAGHTYVYRVYAVNGPSASPSSNTATVAVPPAAPTNLGATLQSGPSVSLTWLDSAANETGFVVERSDNGGAFISLAAPAASAGTGNVTYVDSAVLAGHTYVYRVKAVKGAVSSGYSNTASAILSTAPAAPTGLVATLKATMGTAPRNSLTFRDNAANETGFVIERAVNGGAFAPLVTLRPKTRTGNVTYVDLAVTAGNTYAYRVRSVKGIVLSAFSNTRTLIVPPAPVIPSNFTATTRLFGTKARIDLSWLYKANSGTRFVVQRSTDPAFATVTTFTTAANATGLTQLLLPRGATFYYRIMAQNPYGQSVWVTLTPFPIVTP